MKNTKAIGDAGEELAVEFLVSNGYEIIKRNYRGRYGEIDIVAKEGRTLVFVEVKKKTSTAFGFPAEMVTKAKQEKIKKTASAYLVENDYCGPWRIDVVGILGNQVELIKNITS